MGDCILLQPFIRELSKHHNGKAHITVVTDNQWGAGVAPRIFRAMPEVNAVESVATEIWTTQSNRDVDPMARLAGNNVPHSVKTADAVYDCNGNFIKFERDWQGEPPFGIAEYWLKLYNLPSEDCLPKLQFDADYGIKWSQKHAIKTPLIGFVLKSGSPIRDFNLERMRGLIEWAHTSGYRCATIDPSLKFEIPYVIPIIGEPIDKVASMMMRMRLIVTPDTGIMHLAQAIGVPTVSLWGIMEPKLRVQGYDSIAVPRESLGVCNDPGCKQCGWKFQQWSCMNRITPTMVIGAIEERLGKG
jgi:ADP-heptose:LPS heptosyltransferase